MNPATEIVLTVQRELRKNVRSARGIVLGILTLILSGLAVALCIGLEKLERAAVGAASTEAFTAMKREAFEKATGDANLAATFATLPISLAAFFKFAVWIGPLIVVLLGFDTVAGDMQYKTVRYFTVRTRRWSYFAGKLLGLWAVVALATFALLFVCGLVTLAIGYVSIGPLVRWSLEFWVVSLPISLTWTAIAVFVSAQFRQSILALVTTAGIFFLSWSTNIVAFIQGIIEAFSAKSSGQGADVAAKIARGMRWYEYLYPNSYDALLLSPKPQDVVQAVGILMGFSLLLIGMGAFLFNRKEV